MLFILTDAYGVLWEMIDTIAEDIGRKLAENAQRTLVSSFNIGQFNIEVTPHNIRPCTKDGPYIILEDTDDTCWLILSLGSAADGSVP